MHKEMVHDITQFLVLPQYPNQEQQEISIGAKPTQVKTAQFCCNIQGEKDPKTHCMNNQPNSTTVEKNLSLDGPPSGGVDCPMQREKSSIPKTDHARNDDLSVIKVRFEETQTCLNLMEDLLQTVSTERLPLAISTGE